MSVTLIHRYWNEGNHDHLYTNNAAEIGTTTPGQVGNHGYKFESSSFALFTQHHHGLVPVYRYWNAGTKDHLYSANPNEIGAVSPGQTGNHGYTNEGILGYVSPHEFPGSVPIYRYWQENTRDHLYTTNAGEIGTTNVGHTGNHGYKYEGILGFAYPTDHHLAAVHRYWHDGTHDHLYTTNAGEIGTTVPGAVGNHGYKYESSPFFIFTHHHAGLVPVYRYWQENTHDHLYTSNAGEIGTTNVGQTGNHGYKYEGVLGYVSPNEFYGGIPLLRYWQENTRDHLYTTNAGEIGTTSPGHVGNHGYKFEGIVGYVVHH